MQAHFKETRILDDFVHLLKVVCSWEDHLLIEDQPNREKQSH